MLSNADGSPLWLCSRTKFGVQPLHRRPVLRHHSLLSRVFARLKSAVSGQFNGDGGATLIDHWCFKRKTLAFWLTRLPSLDVWIDGGLVIVPEMHLSDAFIAKEIK